MFPGPADFRKRFRELTGWEALPWQERLYGQFARGQIPAACDLPTGTGKTAVMALWHLAWSSSAPLPRRLVYVVDRRAVVDQATRVAEALAAKAPELRVSTLRGKFLDNGRWREDPSAAAIIVGTVDMIGSRLLFSGYGVSPKMRPVHAGLLGADTLLVLDEAHLVPPFEHLAAAIANGRETLGPRCGEGETVPRLRLLSLSATGRGSNGSAFRLDPNDLNDPFVASVVGAKKLLEIQVLGKDEELAAKMAERAATLAGSSGRCLVYCDRREDADAVAKELRKGAPGRAVEILVGARRVRERQDAAKNLEQLGFLAGATPSPGPAFLVATSAGEVGVDLDADCMVCDVVPWERMVQRLGRVNRRGGEKRQARIEVLDAGAQAKLEAAPKNRQQKASETNSAPGGPAKPRKKSKAETGPDAAELALERQCAALALLRALPQVNGAFDASPAALTDLRAKRSDEWEKAVTPEPLRPELTRAVVEAWSLTSLRNHPGRPHPAPWLRGWTKEAPQTAVVWRAHLPVRPGGARASQREAEPFFTAAPPEASEILEAETWAVAKWLERRAAGVRANGGDGLPRTDDTVAFVLDRDGNPSASYTLAQLADPEKNGRDDPRQFGDALTASGRPLPAVEAQPQRPTGASKKERLSRLKEILGGGVLIVDARLGGLSPAGLLDEKEAAPALAADHASGDRWSGGPAATAPPVGFRVRRLARGAAAGKERGWYERFRFLLTADDDADPEWLTVEKRRNADPAGDDDPAEEENQSLAAHVSAVEGEAGRIAQELRLPKHYAEALRLAARLHDEGKRADRWQEAFHAPTDGRPYGKTEGPINQALLGGYRHEFGSLLRVAKSPELDDLPENSRDLVLHLIAAHHGWSRPVIGVLGCEDLPPSALQEKAREAALRFARLQRAWGPWGLAWWEALLRAADQAASRQAAARAAGAAPVGGPANG